MYLSPIYMKKNYGASDEECEKKTFIIVLESRGMFRVVQALGNTSRG